MVGVSAVAIKCPKLDKGEALVIADEKLKSVYCVNINTKGVCCIGNESCIYN